MAEKPLVSVILPVYNGEKFLAQALFSVVNQTYPSIEILVINDGSTDDSVRVAESFEQVKIFTQDNLGQAAALNRGVKECRGQYISFLDADDFWAVDKTRLQMGFLSDHPDFGCVTAWFRNFIQGGTVIPPTVSKKNLLEPKLGEMPSLGTLLASREHFDRVGLFNTALTKGLDLDWFVRARDLGMKIGKMSRILMHRRIHDSNFSHQMNPGNLIRIFRDSIRRKEGKQEGSQDP